jgi:hypothetical protein
MVRRKRRPILVTGAHRSGTTWIGKMLAVDPQMAYISEPLNVLHRPGVMRARVPHWYTYICKDNEDQYLPAMREMLAFKYHPLLEIKSLRSVKDILRMFRDWRIFSTGRLFDQDPLLKDPFAVFSAEWFADALDCQVVLVVRHPGAVASSLRRLEWNFDFSDLLNQLLLMRDWLDGFQEEMESLLNNADLIAQSSLLWRMVYHVANDLRKRHPEYLIVRHEDISLDPVGEFKKLYDDLELEYSQRVEQTIINSSSESNPKEVSRRAVHSIQVDSRANLENWKQRLTTRDIERVHELTNDVAQIFYPDKSWQ